jgi:phenol 2-monooxygenase
MIIPREGDKVRFYIQLSDSDVLDPITGRVDKNRMNPEKLLEVRMSVTRLL